MQRIQSTVVLSVNYLWIRFIILQQFEMMMMTKSCSHAYKRAAALVAVCTLLSAPPPPPQFAPSLLSPAAHCSTGLAGCNLHQPIRQCVVAPPQYPTHEYHLTAAKTKEGKQSKPVMNQYVVNTNLSTSKGLNPPNSGALMTQFTVTWLCDCALKRQWYISNSILLVWPVWLITYLPCR